MKTAYRKAASRAGVITAGLYLLVFIVTLIAPASSLTLSKALQPIVIVGLFMSPIAFIATMVSIFASASIETSTKRKIALVIVCAIGAFITGWQTIALFSLWKRGPIHLGSEKRPNQAL